ncbi:hypothetical protein GB928_017025 [Shinella curvata]|uniref:Uncharacterized protein n=1 Tax=Shinella curvata TaxID=1817964 RepID=A0ABT8XI89_9HYPH|nr:hypothetical protein [Shinella curvata]MCJ8053568.1 hypothetical protein [Shinella curvata]MDO6122900.1 hypothetical protein [Shinella curvata]
MDVMPPSHAQPPRDGLAERAMRQAATILSELTACRRRACRRNGCCGSLVENGRGVVPSGAAREFSHLPPCIVGIDAELASVFVEQSRILLAFLDKHPCYELHPARLRRAHGKQ